MNNLKTLILSLSACASLNAFAGELSIGDQAPPIKVLKWVQGTPVQSGQGGLRVVEFWATWCGPCKQSIPHLTELSKKYGAKVAFTGVDVWERSGDDVKTVTEFLHQMGAKMAYRVAVDDKAGTMANTWMSAAHQNGIPTAFVVNKSGQIVWIGHPMIGLEEALDQILAGKYDMKQAKATFAKQAQDARAEEQAQLAQAKAQQEIAMAVESAKKQYQVGHKSEALVALDKVGTQNPDLRMNTVMVHFQLMYGDNKPGAIDYARSVIDSTGAQAPFVSMGFALALARVVDIPANATSGKATPDEIKQAVIFAARSVELNKDANPIIPFYAGKIYALSGDYAKAADAEDLALKSVQPKTVPSDMAQQVTTEIKQLIAEYRSKAKPK